MCHFITLVIPKIADVTELRAVLKEHDRGFRIYENKHLNKSLENGEISFLCAKTHCDCGTALGKQNRTNELEPLTGILHERKKKAKLGWSEAKLDRWQSDKLKEAGKTTDKMEGDPDGWTALLRSLKIEIGLPYIGIMLHFYHGDQTTEQFETERASARLDSNLEAALWRLHDDKLLIVS